MVQPQSAVTIARPVEQVYRHFLDLDKNATDPGVESVVKEPSGATGPGTTFRFRHKTRGKIRETAMRFISLEDNQSIEFEGDVGPVRPRGTFTFEPTNGGTRLSVRIDALNPVGPLKILSPLLARIGQRIWDARLERIKAALETAAS